MKSNDSLRFLLLLTCWAGLSCGDPNVLQFAADPALIVNPDFPLVVTVTFETNLPCLARVTVRDGDHSREIDFLEYRNQQHRLPILGLEPASSYELELSILNESGDPIESRKLTHKTASLPPDFPQLHVEESQPERMEPGYTMFGVVNIPSGEGQETPPFTIVLDSAGKVVWYHRGDEGPGTPIVQLDGKFLGIMHESEIAEFTLDGSIYRRWHASQFSNNGKELEVEVHSIPVPTETLHHDLLVLPSGNFLSLSTEVLKVDYFPSDPADPNSAKEDANVISDIVVEFAPDGTLVRQWRLVDLIDPHRFGYESGAGVWDGWGYGNLEGGTKDWLHANALAYWPADDLLAVSLRHLDAVVGFHLETGELVWILGTPKGWGEKWQPFLLEPRGELEWPYHQHAVRFTPEGDLLLFDNGNFRAWPPEPQMKPQDHYSRVVRYAIHTLDLSVRQVWSYGGPNSEHFFSSFVSEADFQPMTGNLLITDGGRTRGEDGSFSLDFMGGRISARVFEITTASPPETVFEVAIEDRSESNPMKWLVYRSERITSLY